MQLNPRYGTDPLVTLDGAPSAIAAPAIRQRARLLSALETFDEAQWTEASRCDGWTCRDVVIHLDSTNFFWTHTITAGLSGEPTRLLADFDPVASPAALVAGADLDSGEVLDRMRTSSRALNELLGSLEDDDWSAIAEAPPGHISINAVVHHALWDSWVHERDILLPLGIAPEEDAGEIAASLRYVAALSPALAVNNGMNQVGRLAIDVRDPDLSVVVEIDGRVEVRTGGGDADFRLEGDALELLEALSARKPLDRDIPDEFAWMLCGLFETFEIAPD